MLTTLLQAGALMVLPAIMTPVVPTPRVPCQLERMTAPADIDARAIARFVTAAHDYVANGKEGTLVNADAAAVFRFRLRLGRWLHRYQAAEALDVAPGTRGDLRFVAPGVVDAALPELPTELDYRVAGPHLLVVDRRTEYVIDLVPDVFAWAE